MPVTLVDPPTAASMRLDGGHPALDLVNTVYGQVGGPVEADVLAAPDDLVTFARRVGMAGAATPAGRRALAEARELRDALDPVLRSRVTGDPPPEAALAAIEAAARSAVTAAALAAHGDQLEEEDRTHVAPAVALAWTWAADDARAPVHRLALAALELLTSDAELARLHQCAGCCWLFLDHSRGAGRRWCSMADCGTEAKKRRYVERRRERRRS